MYLGKQQQHPTPQITATHGTVPKLFKELRDWATKLSWKIILPRLPFGDPFQLKTNACGTVRHDRHGMP
jgi:hypothetical protein